jgi:dihydropteroate synthase
MAQNTTIIARLLPLHDRAVVARELARMRSEETPETAGEPRWQQAVKLLGVRDDLARLLEQWLSQHFPRSWWSSVSGAAADTVDVLLGCSDGVVTTLRQLAPSTSPLRQIGAALERAVRLQDEAPRRLEVGDTGLALQGRTYVMGILNVTPDSFSDGGLYLQPQQAVKRAEEILAEGADLLDVGGASSRPGAEPTPAEVELQRVIPVVRDIVQRYDARVSVDTYRASVAEAALDVGAVMINDISALRFDAGMAPLLARRQAAVVLMHMRGTPRTMQQGPAYRHVIDEVYTFLAQRLQYAMQQGIPRQRIAVDPGVGFGKGMRHNLELLQGLEHFQSLGQALLVGISRKSFLGRMLRREVWERLEGSMASAIYAALRGAALVRVHDVGPTVQAMRLVEALQTPAGRISAGMY